MNRARIAPTVLRGKTNGKPRVGKPRTTWLKAVEERMENSLQSSCELAKDRDVWRVCVQGVGAHVRPTRLKTTRAKQPTNGKRNFEKQKYFARKASQIHWHGFLFYFEWALSNGTSSLYQIWGILVKLWGKEPILIQKMRSFFWIIQSWKVHILKKISALKDKIDTRRQISPDSYDSSPNLVLQTRMKRNRSIDKRTAVWLLSSQILPWDMLQIAHNLDRWDIIVST